MVGRYKKYCAIITFNVRNVFNSAQREHKIRSLNQLKMPDYIQLIIRDYFVDRNLFYDTHVGLVEYLVTGLVLAHYCGP